MIRYVLILLTFVLDTVASGRHAVADDVTVRVFSDARIESAEFATGQSSALIIAEGGETIVELPAGESAVVEVWQGLMRVRWRQGSAPVSQVTVRSTAPVRVTPEDRTARTYRGSVHVTLDGEGRPELLLVNAVDIEDYVASVLPAEYPFTEIEGAKAQAIVIRSYALAAGRGKGAQFVLRDDIGSQVYRGMETETPFSRSVAQMTAGSVLIYDNEIVEAVYSSHCGGHSADNEDIWGTAPVPYLRGRKDPYDHDAPVAEWSTSVDDSDVREGLSRVLGKKVKGIKVADRGKGDHVRTVEIDVDGGPDEVVSGDRFRSLLNSALGRPVVMSSKFEIKKRSGEYRIEGRGNGHGVGLCQWGAAEQAKQGRDYEDILTYYYRDVDVTKPDTDLLAFQEIEPEKPVATGDAAGPSESRSSPRKRRPGW